MKLVNIGVFSGGGRIVKGHNSQTVQNLDPKMSLFRTKSSMIHVDLAKKSIQMYKRTCRRNILSLVRSNFFHLWVTEYFLNYNYNDNINDFWVSLRSFTFPSKLNGKLWWTLYSHCKPKLSKTCKKLWPFSRIVLLSGRPIFIFSHTAIEFYSVKEGESLQAISNHILINFADCVKSLKHSSVITINPNPNIMETFGRDCVSIIIKLWLMMK